MTLDAEEMPSWPRAQTAELGCLFWPACGAQVRPGETAGILDEPHSATRTDPGDDHLIECVCPNGNVNKMLQKRVLETQGEKVHPS